VASRQLKRKLWLREAKWKILHMLIHFRKRQGRLGAYFDWPLTTLLLGEKLHALHYN
jgi:hypothetical protein